MTDAEAKFAMLDEAAMMGGTDSWRRKDRA